MNARYREFVKAFSATEARAHITRLLDRAIAGESIGIKYKGRIIKLQPVSVTEDWAAQEYGLSSEELDCAAEALLKAGERLLASGKTVDWVTRRCAAAKNGRKL